MAKTREELVSMIENELVDPTSNRITGERVKNAMKDIVDAMGTGGAALEYYAIPEGVTEGLYNIVQVSSSMKCVLPNGMTYIMPTASMIINFDSITILAVGLDANMKLYSAGNAISLGDLLEIMGNPTTNFTLISEKEFYTI